MYAKQLFLHMLHFAVGREGEVVSKSCWKILLRTTQQLLTGPDVREIKINK